MNKGKTPGDSSLSAVAKRAKVSNMTVSRVLKNSPRVSPETRSRVLKVIEEMGYKPDPHVARLMKLVRDHKRQGVNSALAVIRDEVPDTLYRYVAMDDIRNRALQHGYHAEEFFLGQDGMTPARLADVLEARGIEGVIASPRSFPRNLPKFDFSRFSSATFGYGLATPDLHRASTNMMQGILTAIDQLCQRGYERIGLVVTEWIDRRADCTYSGALLYHQLRTPKRNHVPLMILPNTEVASGEALFCDWMKKHRPDALITFHEYVPDWLEERLKMKVPDDVGLVVHDWGPEHIGFAGIDHRRRYVAETVVDLVANQLLHNEVGIPEVPRQILIPPAFVDGASIRSKASHPSSIVTKVTPMPRQASGH